ncbi:hypothetical protein [Streptomyces sp. NBRC 110465]|uniref:hypothetical protein n=1 Tax=Streptomyces sp. NBRC 110465 TaxID=1897621 RepID=UPI000933BE18|nr:hypothetical protein [Streptomyces sp. NBRC 110465]
MPQRNSRASVYIDRYQLRFNMVLASVGPPEAKADDFSHPDFPTWTAWGPEALDLPDGRYA